MNARGVVVGVLACLALAGCGDAAGSASYGEPFTLPVGPTEWDVGAPAWFHDGTLHVGNRTQSRGPTDGYGTHVLQVAAFDTRTGKQLYRTPDEEPEDGADLADLYEDITPLLHGVSDERVFFDGTTTPAVVYDAATGRQRTIDAPWEHFTLAGWSDEDTFFGVAERIDEQNVDNVLRARRVVTCELRTPACTPVSPVLPTEDQEQGRSPAFLTEGSPSQP